MQLPEAQKPFIVQFFGRSAIDWCSWCIVLGSQKRKKMNSAIPRSLCSLLSSNFGHLQKVKEIGTLQFVCSVCTHNHSCLALNTPLKIAEEKDKMKTVPLFLSGIGFSDDKQGMFESELAIWLDLRVLCL